MSIKIMCTKDSVLECVCVCVSNHHYQSSTKKRLSSVSHIKVSIFKRRHFITTSNYYFLVMFSVSIFSLYFLCFLLIMLNFDIIQHFILSPYSPWTTCYRLSESDIVFPGASWLWNECGVTGSWWGLMILVMVTVYHGCFMRQ